MMNTYEIIHHSEKKIVGIHKKLKLQTPSMSLWGSYYASAIHQIIDQYNTKAYGVYYDFDHKACSYMVGCEAKIQGNQNDELHIFTIPAGRYAKFCLKGEVHHVVPEFWKTLDTFPIQRSYLCDFEVFPSKETKDVMIEIYISIQ